MSAASPPVLPDEDQRVGRLIELDILDTLPESPYDDVVMLASTVVDCPISLISLVDTDRQWFKARVGLDASETARTVSFCAHAIATPNELFVVNDATGDPRFADNPLVTGEPHIRFYAGMPLVMSTGEALGTLCVIDREPRELTDDESESLQALARQAVSQLELRQHLLDREQQLQKSTEYERVMAAHQRKLERTLADATTEATTDDLTGLLNRRGMRKHGGELFDIRRRTGRQISALMLDIDRFKQFNDDFGHAAGDNVLEAVAETINHVTRPTDVVSRHGGEEFVVLVPANLEEAATLAERLRVSIAAREIEGRQVTASIGVAAATVLHDGVDDLFGAADEALYVAKDNGRNQLALHPV